ncbi:hypothetical protein ACQUZK_09735, partial [Streptococcus pyogenes]|uniref:hypothetical protein n=1 Tax=Streptococcus pyogenes TaxID=1314 RepID=UPI003DA0F834
MSIITIFGGLASTVFWPLGQHLLDLYGWREALQWYAAFLFGCALLHLAIPRTLKVRAEAAPPVAGEGLQGRRK